MWEWLPNGEIFVQPYGFMHDGGHSLIFQHTLEPAGPEIGQIYLPVLPADTDKYREP